MYIFLLLFMDIPVLSSRDIQFYICSSLAFLTQIKKAFKKVYQFSLQHSISSAYNRDSR